MRARVGERQDRLGARRRRSSAPAPGDLRDRLVPADRLELAGALGPDPAQRLGDPQRRVHALGVLAHLAADHAPGERMCRRSPATAVIRPSSTAPRGCSRTGQSCGQTDCMVEIVDYDGRDARARSGGSIRSRRPRAAGWRVLFAIVYFAQGMWYLPNQAITIVLKDAGSPPGSVADFFADHAIPWLIKPLYGLLSDFVPLFGRRRLSYFLTLVAGRRRPASSAAAATDLASYWAAARALHGDGAGPRLHRRAHRRDDGRERTPARPHRRVPVRAVGVHHPRPCWWASSAASWPSAQPARRAFLLAACFPLISLAMAVAFVREPPARATGPRCSRRRDRRSGPRCAPATSGSWPASSSSSRSARPSGPASSTTRPTRSGSASSSSASWPRCSRSAPCSAR